MADTKHTTHNIPLSFKDQFKPVDNIRSLLFFVLHGTLRKDLLKSSLETLIRRHLPILGARLHRDPKSNLLEYRLPQPFPDDYTLFSWSIATHDSSLEAAGIVPQELPPNSTRPSFCPLSVPEIEASVIPPQWPIQRNFEASDCPMLLVHIASYTNGSVLALNLPHSVVDQMGYGSMVRAWLQVAAGADPAPFLELSNGELDGDASLPKRHLKVKGQYRLTSRTDRIGGTVGLIPELVRNKKEIRRLLFLPQEVVENLRNQFNDKLQHKKPQVQLTNGDVISALLFKLTHMARKSPKMVNFSASLNARGRHPSLPADKPYLHNAISFACVRTTINKRTPLFDLALKHRLAMIDGFQPEVIVRNMTVLHEMTRRGDSIHITEPWEMSYAVTNWCGAWRGIDFVDVIEDKSQGKETSLPLVYGHSLERKNPTRFNSQIMCKASGGYWCDYTASAKAMRVIEKLFETDPSLESL